MPLASSTSAAGNSISPGAYFSNDVTSTTFVDCDDLPPIRCLEPIVAAAGEASSSYSEGRVDSYDAVVGLKRSIYHSPSPNTVEAEGT